jgi:hypothetical protein
LPKQVLLKVLKTLYQEISAEKAPHEFFLFFVGLSVFGGVSQTYRPP